jgi:molybdate transport system substrate-binding protein
MYVKTGAADLGITALSLAQSPALTKETQYLVINDKLYEPIKQRMVLMKNPTPLAKEIYQYLQSEQAQALFIKFGYTAP